jgi:hypothetical protein
MAGQGLKEFLAEVGTKDLARSHRFEVIIGTPKCMNGVANTIVNKILDAKIPVLNFSINDATKFLAGSKNTPENANTQNISLMCEEAIFPGLMMGSKPYKYNNRVENRATFLDYNGESATFTFLCDSNWAVKKYFDTWMRKIVDPEKRYVLPYEDYICQIELYSLNQQDEVTNKWIIEEAWPRSMAPASLAWSNTQFVRIPVTFTFRNWYQDQNVVQKGANVVGGLLGQQNALEGGSS